MISPTFSLTEHYVVNPVLYLQASHIGKGNSFFEKELVARVVALASSVFAALDGLVHLSVGCFKGVSVLLGQHFWTQQEVNKHLSQSVFFTCVAVVGSVVGGVWPGVFKYYRKTAFDPFDGRGIDFNATHDIEDFLPQQLLDLQSKVIKGEEIAPYPQLQAFWKDSDLSGRDRFVHMCNQSGFYPVRQESSLVQQVYRPIGSNQDGVWFNSHEIARKVIKLQSDDKIRSIAQAFFFHATSKTALESILKEGRVQVRHEKLFRGAFVSTQPEKAFGSYVLVFNRSIERLSHLEHGFTQANKTVYWAGFSRDIPVNQKTLACVMILDDSLQESEEEELSSLEDKCKQWSGRAIPIVLKSQANTILKRISGLQMGIPAEWPRESIGGAQKSSSKSGQIYEALLAIHQAEQKAPIKHETLPIFSHLIARALAQLALWMSPRFSQQAHQRAVTTQHGVDQRQRQRFLIQH